MISILILQASSGFRRGLVCSPLIAEFLMAMMPMAMPNDVKVIVYVDMTSSFLAKKPSDLECATHALLATYSKSPAGSFTLEIIKNTFTEGVDFLGYKLQLVGDEFGISPSDFNLDQHELISKTQRKAIKRIPKKADSYIPVRRALAKYLIYNQFWLNAFSSSTDIENRAKAEMAKFVALCNEYDDFPIMVMYEAKIHFSYYCRMANSIPMATSTPLILLLGRCRNF